MNAGDSWFLEKTYLDKRQFDKVENYLVRVGKRLNVRSVELDDCRYINKIISNKCHPIYDLKEWEYGGTNTGLINCCIRN